MRLIPIACFLLTTAVTAADAAPQIVTTVPDLAALAREVGGDKVAITSLALPTQDPHFVDAKPSLVLKLNRADLLIAAGLGLEAGWLPTLQNGARNPKVLVGGNGFLDCSAYVRLLEIPKQPVDRAAGDIHPGGNPHYLYDPRQALSCAKAIAVKLAEIDPGNAKAYAANMSAFATKLDKARAGWEKRMAPFKGHSVLTFHRSWTYVLDWLGLVSIGELEPKPGIPPTPSHVAQMISLGKQKGVSCVLQEAYYPDKTARLVAKKLDGQVLLLAAGADVASGEGYIEHIDHMIDAFEKALK